MMTIEKFTIEDIHRIRYSNYEQTKSLTPIELIEYTRREAEEGKKMLKSLRSQKHSK